MSMYVNVDKLIEKYSTHRDFVAKLKEAANDETMSANIVKCKDCKYWTGDIAGSTEHVKRCKWADWMIHENGYCVYGEENDT